MSQLLQTFKRAEAAEQMGNWEEARQLYRHAKSLAPNNGDVDRRLAQLNRREKRDADVQEMMAEGDAQFQAKDYEEAARTYALAIEHAGDAGILKYHAQLEEKRNRARDIAKWHRRVEETRQTVKDYRQQQDWQSASAEVDKVLANLPEEKPYRSLRKDLLQTRQWIEQQMDDEVLYEQARAAIEAKDYEQGIRLLEALPENSRYRDGRTLPRFKHKWASIKESLRLSEEALQEQRWEDAFSQLRTLSSKYAALPRWQALWLQAGRGYGQHLLEKGRQHNTEREFNLARKYFEEAHEVFKRVVEVHREHKSLLDLRDESMDLAEIALQEKQAKADRQAGRREEALVALESAQRRIERASTEGRSYAAVEAVVNVMRQTLQRELERLREARRALENGQRYLEKQQLQRAKRRFEKATDATDTLDPKIKQQALRGLDDVEMQIDQFEQQMEAGRQAAGPEEAVDAYRRAYEIWPEGPEARASLVAALVWAGKRASQAGRDTEAAGYFEQALELDPDHPEAQSGLEKAGVRPEVESTLQETRTKFDNLRRSDDPHAEDFKELMKTLEAKLRKVSDWEDLRAELDALHQEIRAHYQRVQEYEQLSQRAEARRTQGNWAGAMEALDKAMEALGDEVPASARQRQGRWSEVLEALTTVREDGAAALSQAQESYEAVSEEQDLAAVIEQLGDIVEILASAMAPVRTAQELASEVEGPLPEDVRELQEQIEDLQARVEVASDAAKAYSAREGLLKIREAIRLKGADPTLEALQERLEAQVRDLIPELKEQMRTAMEAGNTTEALDLARQIRDLQPGDTEFARTFNRLQRRQQLEDKIITTYKDYESKLSSNSLPDAVKALEDGLDAFLDPEIEWPEEARETLFELRELKSNPLAFGDEAVWEQVQQLLSTLGRQGLESWVARQAQQMATQWAELARDVALKGVVASAAELGNLLQSYRAASEYLKDHTQDEDAIEQLAAAEEKLINQLNSSATKRISRAQEALHDGEFAIALRNLDSLDDDIYGPVDAEFPGLLDKHNEVDQTRREAERLQAEAARLQALDEEVRPKLETAQQVFAEDNLEAAEQALKELPDLSPIPGLKQRAEDLRVKISDARVEHTREALSNLMNRVQTGLRLSTKPEQLDDYVQEMEALQSEIDLDLLDSAKREAYYQLLDRVRVLREELVSGQHWAQEAEKAIEEERYSDAEEALEEALKVTRDAKKKITFQQRLKKIKKQAQEQRDCEDAQEDGEELFYERRYDEARTRLERAKRLGADVGEMLRAARAGALWQKAQHIWQERQNWKIALSSLRRANNLLKDNPFAEDISMEIEILQEELENARVQAEESSKKQDKLARLIAEARRWLADGDLEQAQRKIQDALTIDGNAQEVLDLQNQIRQQREARSWVEKARKAYRNEKFKEALGFVETALSLAPNYPQAKHLKGKIEAERKAQQDLVGVMVLARSDKFAEARERLHELSQQRVDPERVMETQQEVERLEQAWWRKNITPIEEAQRAGNYQEALDKCNEVMSRLASEDYKKQLENQQQQIVNDWAEEVLGQIQPRLQEDASEAHLQEVMIELEQVLNLDPEPTMWLRQLQDALQTAHTLRLRAQLRKAKEHDEEEAYEKALAVVQRVREEIDALDIEIDFTLLFEINDLEWDIKEHKYQALLEQARQKKKAPEHRDDLEQVRDLSGQMLGLPGFEDDAEAKRIQRWAVDELRAFDETKRVLEKCENLVRQRRLSDARYEIRELENVSDLLKPSYEQQRNLISVLRRARDDQKNEAWEAALKGYTQAFEMDSRLIPHLEGERDYVTKKFVASIQRKIEMVLQKPDPDTHKAEELVEQIEAYDVIQETFRRELTRLRDYIASQENVKEALELLDQGEDGEPLEKAQEALQEARRLLPDDVSSGSIQQWQLLVKALLAWSRGERRRAKQVYDRLAPPALDHPRAVELKEAIASAEAVDQNIEDAQKKIREFLSAEPVRYDEAIDILDSLTEIEMDDRVKALQRKVIGPLYRELKRARQTYHYAEAIEYGKLLQSMPGIEEEKEKIQVIDQLSEERRTKLNERIAKAEAALAKYKLSEVEKFLVQAETIAAPKGDPRLPDLRGQLEARQRVIEEEVKPGLQKLHVLIGNQQWSDAVDKLLDVRSQAPNHKNVEAAVDDLQNRLYTQAETLYEADNFDQALDRCEDGLRLRDDRSDLLELQGKIRADREARLIALRAEIEAALDIWRLEEASEKLREGKQISSSDQKLEQLDDRLQKRKRQLPELRQSLDAGWKDLRHRDYLAAKAAFEDALAAARSFTEAEGWRDYAESMNEAVKLVESEGDEYKQVAELLFNAEQAVRVKPEHPLPDVWESEDYLRERHRQAVYDAHRLRQVVHRMIENYREYEKLFKQSSHDAMSKGYEFYQQVLEEKETLRALHRTPASPPDDFPTDGLDEEAIPSSLLGSVDPVPAQAPKVRKESGKLEEAETDEKPPVPEMVYGEDKGDSDEKFEAERIEETPEQSDEGGLLSFIKGFRRGAPTEDEESKKGEREPEGVGDEPSTPEAVSKPSRRPSLEPEEAEEVEEVEKVKDETEPTDEDTVDAESPEESVSPPPRRRPGKPRKREDREVPSSRAEEASSQGSSDVEEEGDSEEEESTSAAPGGDYADLDEVFGGFGQTTLHSYEDEE